MHNHFLDKNRRHINLRTAKIQGVLPEYFAASYPKFISLLEHYYDFLNENDSTEILTHLFASRDVNETDITLLSFIEDELLLGDAYFQGFSKPDATPEERETQLRAAANFSSIMFRSKGTRFAIEWFFRSFYGIDAEVIYPKENIFTIGEIDSKIGADSLRYLTDDKLYQTFALLIRVGIPISQWKEIFKLFAHPAGMYLAGEVLIEGISESTLSTDDSAVLQRNTPEYALNISPSSTASEGTAFDFTLIGSDIPDNTSALYYYVSHILTSDSDFVSTPPSVLSPEYFDIYDSAGEAVGHFSIPTRIDSSETEGTETFNVFIQDDDGRVKAQSLINLQDIVSAYTISPDNATPSEGELINFSVEGTNVPNNGNTTLFYYVQHGSTTDADFVTPPPSTSNAEPFSILNDSGSFSLRTKVDGVSFELETFTVALQTEANGGIQKGSTGIFLQETTPTFNLSVSSILEGESIVAQLVVDSTTIGETINWDITGAAESDSRVVTNTGSFLITDINELYTLSGTTSDITYHGPINGQVEFTSSVSGFTDNDGFTLSDQAASYTITPSPSTASEGDSVSYAVGGTNIPDSDVNFYVSFGETDAADFVGTVPTIGAPETVTISSGVSSPSPLLQFAVNGDLTPESFTAVVSSTSGSVLAELDYTIIGNLTYDLTVDSDSIDESFISFSAIFDTTDSDGQYYYWIQGSNITPDDFVSGYASVSTRQAFTVSGGTGTINTSIKQDKIREGDESFTFSVSKTTSGGAVSVSPVVTIADTSTPTYTLAAPDITEGDTLTTTITADTRDTEFLYFEISGAGVTGRFTDTQKSLSVSGNNSIDFDTTSSPSSQGDQTGTITARINSHTGLIVGSDTFVLSDDTLSATLVSDLTGDSANEGDTINFTFSGTNIPDGTYHHRTSNIYSVRTDQVCPQGTFFIYLKDTSNLAVGMKSNTGDIPGTIVSVSPGSGVTMSNSIPLSSLPIGYDFHFAQPEVFEDFDTTYVAAGSFSVSSNSGTFRVDTEENDDLNDDVYTFGVYDSHIGSLLASRLININDTTDVDLVEVSNKPFGITTTTSNQTTTTTVRFEPDGDIMSSLSSSESVTNTVGTWLNPTTNLPANASDYEIRATRNYYSGVTTGSFGTWETLNQNRTWTITVSDPNFSADVYITFEIREKTNSNNSDSWSVLLEAFENYEGGGPIP
ncbi:hypothetical protein N9A42_00765 [bacterium]|nr:hypothetical protein [bacterium]